MPYHAAMFHVEQILFHVEHTDLNGRNLIVKFYANSLYKSANFKGGLGGIGESTHKRACLREMA
jgi:hypothetical protein